MFMVSPQSWAGITAMVRCAMSLGTGSGGAVLRIVVRGGTTCITMVVAYIPTTAASASLGTTCGVSRPPSMASTSAVSRPPKV